MRSIGNSKHEIRSTKQYLSTKEEILNRKLFMISYFGHLDLFRISRLVLRASAATQRRGRRVFVSALKVRP